MTHFCFLSQGDVKKPKSTKHLHTVVLQETGSTVTKTVQLTLKQSAVSSAAARMNNRLETPSSQSPTPPGSPSVLKVSANRYTTHPCKVRFDLDIIFLPTDNAVQRLFSLTFLCANSILRLFLGLVLRPRVQDALPSPIPRNRY